MGADARRYSWPPFAPGNVVAAQHGCKSDRLVDAAAAEIITAVLERRPDLAVHPEALLAWGRAEARCVMLTNHFANGIFNEDGSERPGLRYIAQFERLANDLRGRLGLDPSSEARLAVDRADAARQVVDLDAIRARGRQAIEARAK